MILKPNKTSLSQNAKMYINTYPQNQSIKQRIRVKSTIIILTLKLFEIIKKKHWHESRTYVTEKDDRLYRCYEYASIKLQNQYQYTAIKEVGNDSKKESKLKVKNIRTDRCQ